MRSPLPLLSVLLLAAFLGAGCDGGDGSSVPVAGREGARKTSATGRAGRRAYDGAPPVVPHGAMGMDCIACHNERGMHVDGVGFAPPSPHEATAGLSSISNCEQCHVQKLTDEVFVASAFVGMPQDLRSGSRAYEGAPPVMPHGVLMRENCAACHSGPAAREEIRTSHPERANCLQCHPVSGDSSAFAR